METTSSPLKILSLDGSGLQALTTLSILGEICRVIAVQKGEPRTPAPCELFDVICGIGTGGWLALLLGRYRLDVPSCTAVYMEMAAAIDPQMNGLRFRGKNKSYRLDQSELIAKIKQVLYRYGLTEDLLDEDVGDAVRCKHVFVAAAVQDLRNKEVRYQLFRTYHSAGQSSPYFRPGPDPETCQVWQACAATGAAKYFLEPYQVGGVTFFDERFPAPHPISCLALDEALHIFKERCPISTVVNIGPGIPNDADVKVLEDGSTGSITKLTRKFSWPTKRKWKQWSSSERMTTLQNTSSELSKEALGMQHSFEDGVRARLKKLCTSGGDDVYFHLGPEYAESRLCLNDVCAIDASSRNTDVVLETSKAAIARVASHLVVAY